MTRVWVLTPRQLEHLRAVVAHPGGIALRVAGPWSRAVFTALANHELVRMEKRAAVRRLGESLFTVEETWVLATPRGISMAARA